MDIFEPIQSPANFQADNIHSLLSNFTFISSLLGTLTSRNRPFPKTSIFFKDEYDYIIIGGGSAGSVMAGRLSQKPCVSVLLLEAGGTAPLISDIPLVAPILHRSPIDWLYKTTPQKFSSFAHIDNREIWSSGKALGGSSVLNAMIYARGHRKNYDDWEDEGADGWNYDEVLPLFKRMEDNRNIEEVDKGYHSVGGPLTVEKPKYESEIKQPLVEAMQALGFELTDPNGRKEAGIYDIQGTLRNGQRCSTAKAYLVPAEDRENLDMLTHAFVTKILIKDRKAYGVEFDYFGKSHTVRARKEVIVSVGTVRTPQILMLSGIGPKNHLEEFNIDVVADLPVGKNLHDHYGTYMFYELGSNVPALPLKLLNPVNILEYATHRSGLFSCPNGISLVAFLDGLNTNVTAETVPRQQLHLAEVDIFFLLFYFNLRPEVFAEVYGPYIGKPLLLCKMDILQPKSRGEVTLNSRDPYDPPNINPNYYQEESDLHDAVEGMKACHEIAMRKEMESLGTRPLDTVFPGCEKYSNIDELFTCQAKMLTTTLWHPVGTARMGQADDPRSVVDPQLRVIGIEGLRVVNAAVMPSIPAGNTNVPTIMVAEKAYDMMKDDIVCKSHDHIIFGVKK